MHRSGYCTESLGTYLRLGQVIVHVLRPVLALQVLLLDQDVDALLDHADLRLEPGIEKNYMSVVKFTLKEKWLMPM